MSHGYNFGQVVAANSDDVALPIGAIQIYANGTLVKGPVDPLVYLVVNGQKRGFTSGAVFTGLGYSFANIQWAPVNTFNDIPTGANINSTSETGLPMSGPGPQSVTCGGTSGGNDDGNSGDCSLSGNAGDITVTQDNTYTGEEVGEGEEEVEVLGFEVEADDDSDVAVTSVKVELKQTDTDVSQDLEDYVDEVLVMFNGDVVGSADADDFNESSDIYTKNISLDCSEVMAGETETFTVALTAVENLDSADIADENWEVELMSVRFEDGDGVTSTESISSNAIDTTIDFVDFSTAADVELNVSLNDDEDDVNEAHNVIVEDDEDTDDEPILAFTLEAEGDSDILVKEIPVLLTTSDADIATVISSADLYHGTTKVDSQNITAGATTDTVTFEDLDINIDAGDTEEFWVKVNILETDDGTNYVQGATLNAQVTVASIDADDEEGDELTGGELTGSAIGENASLFSQGITVEVMEAETDITATDTALGDVAQFTWELEITNIGDDDVYINADNADVVASSTAGDVDDLYTLVESGSNALTALSGTVDSDESAINADASAFGGGYNGETFFKLDSGETLTVNIVVSGTNGTAAGQVRAYLAGIEWTTDDVTCATACDGSSATISSYTANLDEDSETPYMPIN
jgi:hypothetical protein